MKLKDITIGKKLIYREWAGDTGTEVTVIDLPQKICGLWCCFVDTLRDPCVPLSYLSEN